MQDFVEDIKNTISKITKRDFMCLIDDIKFEKDYIHLPEKPTVVFGDIHGDLNSIFKVIPNIKDENLLFLGDYVDRGGKSVEVLYLIFKLKIEFRNRVFLLRGNHEPPFDLIPYPHDLPSQIRKKFNDDTVYHKVMDRFQELPFFAFCKDFIFMHGGIPVNAKSVSELKDASRTHPESSFLTEILWNDPIEEDGVYPSPRGAGYLFGRDISDTVLKSLGFKFLVRSHEPCNGIKIMHSGRVITVFSRVGFPYSNSKFAILRLKFDEKCTDDILRNAIFFR